MYFVVSFILVGIGVGIGIVNSSDNTPAPKHLDDDSSWFHVSENGPFGWKDEEATTAIANKRHPEHVNNTTHATNATNATATPLQNKSQEMETNTTETETIADIKQALSKTFEHPILLKNSEQLKRAEIIREYEQFVTDMLDQIDINNQIIDEANKREEYLKEEDNERDEKIKSFFNGVQEIIARENDKIWLKLSDGHLKVRRDIAKLSPLIALKLNQTGDNDININLNITKDVAKKMFKELEETMVREKDQIVLKLSDGSLQVRRDIAKLSPLLAMRLNQTENDTITLPDVTIKIAEKIFYFLKMVPLTGWKDQPSRPSLINLKYHQSNTLKKCPISVDNFAMLRALDQLQLLKNHQPLKPTSESLPHEYFIDIHLPVENSIIDTLNEENRHQQGFRDACSAMSSLGMYCTYNIQYYKKYFQAHDTYM